MTQASVATRREVGRGSRGLLAIAALAVSLAAADTYVVVLALPDMMAGVGLSIDDLQKATPVISGFLLGYIAVLPLIGRLSDVVSRRRVLLWCLALFVVGSAITALAVDLSVLVGGRVVQGVGGGGLVPATLALVADLWPPHRRGVPLGVVGAVQEVGSVLGPLLGALVLAVSDWRGIFWLNVALGLALALALALTARRLPTSLTTASRGENCGPSRRTQRETQLSAALGGVLGVGLALLGLALIAPQALVEDVVWGLPFVPFGVGGRLATPIGYAALALLALWLGAHCVRSRAVLARLDLVGAALVAVVLGSLVLTFASADPEREVVGPLGHVLLPVGALALLVALWWHRRAARPLVPRGIVTRRVGAGMLASLAAGAALVAVVVDVPVLARLTLTDSQTQAALVLVRFLVALPLGALAGGALLRRVGNAPVAAVGLLAASAGLGVMTTWGRGSLAETVGTTVVMVVVGFGLGLAIAPVNAAVLDDVPHDAHGVASSLVVVARMVGMVVGLALLTAYGLRRFYEHVAILPDTLDPTALLDAGVVQVQTVFAGAALCALAGALAAAGLGWRRAG